MKDKQKIHEIAVASLPILYQQFKDNKGKVEEFDVVAEYKRIVHELEDDNTIE